MRFSDTSQKPSDPLRNPGEAFGDLKEGQHKAELELVDRYQASVAELLRLSFAGIAFFGFLYTNIFHVTATDHSASAVAPELVWAKELAALRVFVLSLCAGNALVFRFFATEAARYYIEALRFTPDQPVRAQQSLQKRHRRIIVCRWSKGIAPIFLGLGSLLVATAFCILVRFS